MAADAGAEQRIAQLEAQLAEKDDIIEQLETKNQELMSKAMDAAPSLSVSEALERYRKRFVGSGKRNKPVRVMINGKAVKTRVFFGEHPLPNLIAPPIHTPENVGELVMREENAVTITNRATHQHAVLIPAGATLRFEFTVQDSATAPSLDIGFSLRKRPVDAPPCGWRNLEELPWQGAKRSAEREAAGAGTSESTRYSGEVVGQWGAALAECEVVFCWDNSYSWLRKKTIVFCADVYGSPHGVGGEDDDEGEGEE